MNVQTLNAGPVTRSGSVRRNFVWRVRITALLIVVGALQTGCADTPIAEPDVEWLQPKIRGVTLDSRGPVDVATLLELRDMGVSHVTLITFGWQERSDSATVSFRPNARWFTESDSGIVETARLADSLGLQVIIKPHLWVRDTRGGDLSRDRIGFKTEADWIRWQDSYRRFILHHAKLSQSIDAPFFVIGTELRRAARERPTFWRELVNEVRSVYDGDITYAANWYEEFQEVEFWDALDFIGVQAYFPLSSSETPVVDDMLAGWTKHRNSVRSLAARYAKPILFTEIGYRSETGVAREPWAWAPRTPSPENRADMQIQADLYEAFFRTFWELPWFSGAIVWKWDAHGRVSERDAIDFTLKGKPASDVITRWFLGSASKVGETPTGGG